MPYHLLKFLLLFPAVCFCLQAETARHKLLVLSVDGLDWRYLRDRNQLRLRIPHLRRMLEEGRYAQGVVGVWPTITWPSHTSLITGVRPDQHGILGNRRPKSEGGDYYWTVNLLKAPTLWQAAMEHGLVTASITWPVTTDASISFDLPEYFQRRNGGSMDFLSVARKSTPPELMDEISRAYPSFPQQWVDDRTRTLATIFLLRQKAPDLLLVHFVDLDSEEHDQGPFETNANAILERTDELIGEILHVLPANYQLALVSDHGFERVDKTVDLSVLLEKAEIKGKLRSMGGIAATNDESVAEFLRGAQRDPTNGIEREIPHEELVRYAPDLKDSAGVFEPVEHVMFGVNKNGDFAGPPYEKGNHGFWPLRADYRSVFVLYGRDVRHGTEPEMQMVDIAGRLASSLGLRFPER
ncbi:MAG: alkaline phosphatase family protein [Acidobacteriaceae bacterium]|nr:alkaline phosphatase family protein [Acidobacteriaceae bacterium]